MAPDSGHSWRLFLDHVDDLRATFNSSCVHLESWQVASYTLSIVFIALYIHELIVSERPLKDRIKDRIFYLLRTLPWVHKRLMEDLNRVKKEMEEDVHEMDTSRDFYKFIPERPISDEEILAEANLYYEMGECKRRLRRAARPQEKHLTSHVASLFGWSNPRDNTNCPGARKMESEIVRMCLSLYHGGPASSGLVLPSTAESFLVALSSARSYCLSIGIRNPSLVASSSSSPSLFHAAKLLGMRIRKVACKRDGSVDTVALKRECTSDTAIIVVAAPNALSGTMDPIESVAKVAQRYSIPLHVDCSLGGFILPFLELCDLSSPSFDFRLPGVSSISLDLSQFGQSPAQCAVTLFRDRQMLKRTVFCDPDYPGGVYCSLSLSDSLDGCAVASAWTALLSTGRDGFVDSTLRLVDGTRKMSLALQEMEGVEVLGSADSVVVAFETVKFEDIYYVAEVMRNKGWPLDTLVSPPAARLVMTMELSDEKVQNAFLDDLDTILVQLRNNPHLADGSSSKAFHNLIQKTPDRWLVNELAAEKAIAHYSLPPQLESRRSMRTLSVEGRKMSLMSAALTELDRKKAPSSSLIAT